jgi:hypothetical protein
MKIGIVVDNYKVPTYKKSLTGLGFEFETEPWKHECTSIIVNTDDPEAKGKIQSMCTQLETYFKAMRN